MPWRCPTARTSGAPVRTLKEVGGWLAWVRPLWWSASQTLRAYERESVHVVWALDGLNAPVGSIAAARVAAATRGTDRVL